MELKGIGGSQENVASNYQAALSESVRNGGLLERSARARRAASWALSAFVGIAEPARDYGVTAQEDNAEAAATDAAPESRNSGKRKGEVAELQEQVQPCCPVQSIPSSACT